MLIDVFNSRSAPFGGANDRFTRSRNDSDAPPYRKSDTPTTDLGGAAPSLPQPCDRLILNAVQALRGADQQLVTHDDRRGHAHVVVGQRIGVEHFELGAGLDGERHAIFVQAEELSGVAPG